MSFDDERVRFYMKHRDQIDEWAALREDAMAAIDQWLEGLERDVGQLVQDLGPPVRLHVHLDHAYPSFRLVGATWPVHDVHSDPSVSLEWERGRAAMRQRMAPYVGVRAHKTHPVGLALRGSEPFRRVRMERKDDASAWWPAFRYVLPGPEFPVNTEDYRQSLLNALQGCWTAYAPVLEATAVAPRVTPGTD